MHVDQPLSGATVTTPFTVSGWAIDIAAPTGSGVDWIHVWAFPTDGGGAKFVGLTNAQLPRPGVAAHFGNPRFTNSGFSLVIDEPLPPGKYLLRVFAHSTATGTFNNMRELMVVKQ